MICALISLLCGYIYVIRFDSMRNSYKVVEWANELQSSRTGIWWNIWIFLALPATWLAWSIILYLACAMSLIWRSGTAADADRSPMTPNQALAGRVCLTVLLAIGVVYLILVILTLRHFGDQMDEAWQRRLSGWVGDAQRERATRRDQEPVISRRATRRRQLPGESREPSVEIAYRYRPPPPRPPHIEIPIHTIQMSG
ncbi:hypothetical protein HYPSUDRAFT_144303 [Hypholoma sublateritium FD-334 SS-4]|uniref:Uncharacterized protein n=1 Tax=Hypholoma sublateritium (strain FD-334 SS-4) TaxID=945553 RepID=A0A0D2NQ67_HYPSF|nr:hypothetical protein HYPSUDRAFT_144303 [Hypholoma sublateritium FD-334 SS-4]